MNNTTPDNLLEPKKYPVASPEVAAMLGIHGQTHDFNELPTEALNSHHVPAEPASHALSLPHLELPEKNSTVANVASALKAITPYVVVFSVALFVYFYFFGSSSFDFTSTFQKASKPVQTAKQNALADLEQKNLAGYNAWVNQFYYQVSDPKIIDPEADNSGNGLTNFQKYLLNLNPKSYDTLGLGMADSEALAAGINPLSGNKLTDSQKTVMDSYFDMEVISNRLALSHLQKSGEVAGAQTNATGSNLVVPNAQAAPSNNYASPDVFNASGLDIDTTVPGRLEIPSLKVNAPIMWSSDPKDFDKDLQSGVIHYPGTALPGQIGTTYISGHSSNYVWAKGDYNHVFTQLDKLPDNTSFKVTVVQKNGKDAILHYVVVGRQEYKPTDQAQFQNSAKSVVALSTCWPVGSTARRLVVFGELTQVEK